MSRQRVRSISCAISTDCRRRAVFGLGTLHAYFVYLECLKEMEAFDPIPVMISAASYGVYSQRDPRATIITVREPTETEALLAMSGPGPSRV